jgi:hypothetical protein
MKILLPSITSLPNSSAHGYPFQIAYRAEKCVTGAIFYYSFVDLAVGQYLHEDARALEKIRTGFADVGVSSEAWETNWACLEYYLKAFPSPVFQNALFSMVMHWDWYIARLGGFVEFARRHVPCPPLDTKDQNGLARISQTGIANQLGILGRATGLSFNLPIQTIDSVVEMDLVRNLGIHHQWEVDDRYLKHSANKSWTVGDIRTVSRTELAEWRDVLSKIIVETCTPIARAFHLSPAYIR